jgi:hypothetical protein
MLTKALLAPLSDFSPGLRRLRCFARAAAVSCGRRRLDRNDQRRSHEPRIGVDGRSVGGRTRADPLPTARLVAWHKLDAERVRLFAQGKNVQNLDAFIGQIEAANLWQFVRRPLDLDWLVEFWHSHGRLGSLAEMLDVCLAERLQESNLDRARQDKRGNQTGTVEVETIDVNRS